MAKYKIINKIALGEPGSTVDETELIEAGVNIVALIESGHIECDPKPARAKAQTEE